MLIIGVFFLLAGLFKLGGVTSFIAKPVLRGFAFGLALTIILKQLASVVGVHLTDNNLIRFLPQLLEQLPHWNWPAALVAAVALLVLWLCARVPRLPGGLVVIVLGVIAGQGLNLQAHGVALIGLIDLRLELGHLPVLPFADWLRLGELAFALVMILYAESYGSISSFALKHGDRVSSNRDLLALGAANLVSGLFHGMPTGAGYSATSANEAAGAYSRLAGIVAALVILVIVLTVLPVCCAHAGAGVGGGGHLCPGPGFEPAAPGALLPLATRPFAGGVCGGGGAGARRAGWLVVVGRDQRGVDVAPDVGGGYPGAWAPGRQLMISWTVNTMPMR